MIKSENQGCQNIQHINSELEPTFSSDMLRTDSMVGIFSETRAVLLRDPIWFEGTKAEAEEAIMAMTARTIGENLVILMKA